MRKKLLCFTLYALIIYLTCGTPNPAIAASHPLGGHETHFCGVIDGQWNKRYADQFPNRHYARTSVANLNIGEPRTVRMIYFLPNDRPYRADVIQRMKDEILNIQTFFAEQMEAHGYGEVTFRIETDSQDEPMVHDMIGKHPDSYYLNRTLDTVYPEVAEMFDLNANVYLIVIDNGMNTIGFSGGRAAGGLGVRLGKSGGFLLLPSGFRWNSMVHELGHAFGLWHSFNDPRYIMSYGPGQDRLSACHAGYLSVHPYFNSDTPIEEEQVPTIEPISPRPYPAGSKRVSIQLKVSDPEGLHQVLLFVTTIKPHFAAGFLEVKECRGLEGEKDTVVEFDYDGVIPSDGFTNLSDPPGHKITIEAVDTDGNVSRTYFTLTEISPHRIVGFDEHATLVSSVSFSPDGKSLASGSWDGTVKLWDVETQQNIATFDEHTREVLSVSFSPDRRSLASGSWDGTVKLWDVETQTNIATLPHDNGVSSVSFSRDEILLVSGSTDGTVKLWDVETQQSVITFDEHVREVSSVSFSPDGRTLASGSYDNTVKLWDVETQQSVITFDEHVREVSSVSFSPDGRTLASGSYDNTVKLWDVETQTNIATLPHNAGCTSVSFSHDGMVLVSGWTDGTVRLWDVATRKNFATLWHTSWVNSVSFSSDGITLASGTKAGTVELWNTAEWMQLRLELMAEVDIPDPNLRAAIEKALGKVPGDTITALDMENLIHLNAREAGVMSLTGLEAATNVTGLLLDSNSITDISALSGLTRLTVLSLSGNSISDISALSGLTRLTELYLRSNSISNISALSGLTKLTVLFLHHNSISDISALSGLTRLTMLLLHHNSISDISALSGLTGLTVLFLSGNSITDISALSGLTKLTELYLSGNSISDISPLVANTGLGHGDKIFMVRNPLSYLSIHTHIPTLESRGVAVTFDNRTPARLVKISGDNQKGAAFAPLPDSLVVEVRDKRGTPFAGVSVVFTVTEGDGTLSITHTTTDADGRAESTLTLGPNLGTNTVSVSAPEIERVETFNATSNTLPTEYRLSIPAGISLIHVPLKVTAIDGMEQTIESVADLYDALGGAGTVNFLITYDSSIQEWLSYFVPSDKGTPADRGLTADMGIIAGMRAPVSVQFNGDPLGTDGSSIITLNQGLNLVGLPLRDPRIARVSALFALKGIGGNVPVIILTDGGEFKAVGRADDPGDVPVTGGQSFILNAQRPAKIDISGGGWYNASTTTAAPPPIVLSGIQVTDTTPVLALRGSIVDEGTDMSKVDFHVKVKNLSTDRTLSTVTGDEENVYQLAFVDIETTRAARIGDILEISARSPNPFIGVEPLQYTVTAEDVKRGLIQLPELVAYEIPAETELLANYPNPFNPETWIPYRLAEDAFVTLTIYDQIGQVVRILDVGHQTAAVYENRSKVIYWDGRNEFGEAVASGVYFYHLAAGDYSATRKMVILK